MSNKPLYKKILDNLISDINQGVYKENDQLPTEFELSQTYNVSRITSKRALSELENLGYIYRTPGKGSFVKKANTFKNATDTKNILLIYPFLTGDNTGLGDYAQGILAETQDKGYHLLIQTDSFLENTPLEELLTNYIGIIYYPQRTIDSLEVLYQLHLNGIPIVILDKIFHGLPFNTITSDNLAGGELATNHLIENNHQNIAFGSLWGEIDISSVRDRYLGYLNALHTSNMNKSHHFVQKEHQSIDDYLTETIEAIKKERITGIVMENDVVAIRLINQINQHNINIPDNLAIVGFDNIQAASLIQPSLTTIEQDFVEIGRIACQIIFNQLKVGNHFSEHQTTEVKLIERSSSCPK